MDPHAWQVFIDAAERGSLSKVALAHGTSQPHISRIIATVEEQAGGLLFQRTGRGVTLTELGERLAPQIRAWLAQTEELANTIRTASGTPSGKIRIGSLPSTAYPLLTQVALHLKTHFPLIQLAVREGQGAQLDMWLEDGSVDLALLFRTNPTPKNGDVYLIEAPTFLVGAPGDPFTAHPTVECKRLHKLPLVSFCRPNSWRDHLEDIARAHDITLDVVLEADSLSLQTQMAAAGRVHALLGPHAIANAKRTLNLQAARIIAPTITRYVALACAPRGKTTLALRTVMRVIREMATAAGAGATTAPQSGKNTAPRKKGLASRK
jgi:DNA-binding transcriptional LysR family regulator